MSNKEEIPVYRYDEQKGDGDIAPQWWLKSGEEAARAQFTVVNSIRNDQKRRRLDWINYARLYANQDIEATLSGLPAVTIDRRLSFNLAKGVVRTACAKISQAKPRPLFLTTGGTYGQKKRAQKLTQYTDGMFSQYGAYKAGKKAFRDACIFGSGLVKVVKLNDSITYQRTFPDELVVDAIDGREGEPRQLHHILALTKEAIVSSFGIRDKKKLEAINAAKAANEIYRIQNTRISDRIIVIESWHLPSAPGAKDGKHTISISSDELFSEPWEHDFFPFAKMDWDEPILGYWGESLVSEVIGIQLEINNVLQRIKEGLEIVAVPRVLVEENSGVSPAKVTDEIGSMISYRNTAPQFILPKGMGPEAFQFLEYLYKKGFEETGLSQLSAQSKKPAGLESAVAMREYQNIETERFTLVSEAYQNFYLDIARITIAFQRDIAEELKKKEKEPKPIKIKKKGFIETIKWSEVDLDEDKFIMQPFPVNFLPRTPEGKLQFTQELVQSGYIDEKEALSLLDYPDLERFFNLRVAALDEVERLVEQIIEDGRYEPPEPYMDLTLTLRVAQAAYLKAKNDGVSEVRLELLRRFLDDTQDLVTKMSTPPPGAMPPGAPNAPDMMPPMPGVGPTPGPSVNPQMGAPGAIARPVKPPRSDLMPIRR